MGGRKVLTVVALCCALALGAITASGAFGAATAFTCKAGQGSMNSHCVPGSTGTSGHVAINPGEDTEMELKSVADPEIAGKLFGSAVEIKTSGVECQGRSCWIEDRTEAGVMEVVGGVEALRFDGAHLVGLPECTITDGSVFQVPETFFSAPLEFTTTMAGGLTLWPKTGTVLAKFSIIQNPSLPEPCTVTGENFKLTGSLKGTLSGATLNFNITKASNEVKLEGEKASFKGELTLEGGNTAPYTPISLT